MPLLKHKEEMNKDKNKNKKEKIIIIR